MKHAAAGRRNTNPLKALLIVCVVIVAIGCGLYLWKQRPMTNEVKLSGTITSDTCSPDYNQIPDTGCSITVKGYTVDIEEGFSALPFKGTVTGQDGNSLKGRRADVFARRDGSKTLDISTDSKYYVHIH